MSTSQIPNLSTFRRGGLRGRGLNSPVGADARKSKDEIVRNTDNDAAISRLSAVDAGYIDDPFTKIVNPDQLQRRLPLMNRGTYVRTVGIDRIVDTFVASCNSRKQIISLGAGSDTRNFKLRRKYLNLDLIYHEIDFEANTKTKIERLTSQVFKALVKDLSGVDLDQSTVSGGNLTSTNYYIHARDLRSLGPEAGLPGLDSTLPTLLISECCLIYLSPEEADSVLSYFTSLFASNPLAIAVYEPIRPGDPFGKTMVRNLIARGIHLQTLEKYAELADQQQRLHAYGFDGHAADIHLIWQKWIDEDEKERVDKLEWMDEVEEFILLAKHYCISWGWKGWENDTQWKRLPSN